MSLIRAVAQPGSALPWGGRGPGFKSRRPDEFAVGGTLSDRPLFPVCWGAPEIQSATNQRWDSGCVTRDF